MDFSEPGCAITTTTTTPINSSTPLHFARSLLTAITYGTSLPDFTHHLALIHDAAYLLTLPKTSPAEIAFEATETARISNGPSGDAVLGATALFLLDIFPPDVETASLLQADIYEATGRMLRDLAAEEQRYLDNMSLLLADLKGKWKGELIETGSWHHTARTMGESGIASARALADLVGDRATAPYRGRKYLSEIARYWRTWAGTAEAGAYEEAWEYVAGRALVQE